MHGETYEQFTISEGMIGEQATFLQDGMSVTLMSHEGEPISVTLPEQVVVTVVEADAVVKGQTASSSTNRLWSIMACGYGTAPY